MSLTWSRGPGFLNKNKACSKKGTYLFFRKGESPCIARPNLGVLCKAIGHWTFYDLINLSLRSQFQELPCLPGEKHIEQDILLRKGEGPQFLDSPVPFIRIRQIPRTY